MSVQLLQNPTDSQIEEVVALLLRAYTEDVPLKYMTDGDQALQEILFRALMRAAALEGVFYVVASEDGTIRSVGICYAPGTHMMGSEAQRALGWNDFMASINDDARTWWSTTFQEHLKEFGDLLGGKTQEYWRISNLATDPQYQRKGYATLLVNTICARVRSEKRMIALATQHESNKQWYEGFGFITLGQSSLSGRHGDWTDYMLTWSPQ
ncbi:hypothetical protein C8J56DRAFT_1066438 [Mycena floridula]|nr:hypothetical protein C8J56DRAFT_1066438 [Mycena floridula]